jgi:hypothetical protein
MSNQFASAASDEQSVRIIIFRWAINVYQHLHMCYSVHQHLQMSNRRISSTGEQSASVSSFRWAISVYQHIHMRNKRTSTSSDEQSACIITYNSTSMHQHSPAGIPRLQLVTKLAEDTLQIERVQRASQCVYCLWTWKANTYYTAAYLLMRLPPFSKYLITKREKVKYIDIFIMRKTFSLT